MHYILGHLVGLSISTYSIQPTYECVTVLNSQDGELPNRGLAKLKDMQLYGMT